MPLSLCTYNLKDFFGSDAIHERKVAYLARLIASADADVVALQEVGVDGPVESLFADASPMDITVGTPDSRGICNVVASRLPVIDREVYSPRPLGFPVFQAGDPAPFEGRLELRRGVVRVRVASDSIGPVDVIACHLKSKIPTALLDGGGMPLPDADLSAKGRAESDVRSLVCRLAEALFVRELADSLFAQNPAAHVAVVGDLNDTLESAPVAAIRAAGFRPPQPLASALFPCTDAVEPARRFSILSGEAQGELFDHILVSWGLRARLTHARILNEELRDHGPFDPNAEPAFDSDHAPVVASFA